MSGGTALHEAAARDHKEIVELLIDNGADVNVKDAFSETPLDEAINYKRTVIADLLRKHGGKTGEELSIHKAAKKGNIEAIKQHIANGADVNAVDDFRRTPLDRASGKETADLLRKHGGMTGEELKAAGN